MSQTHFCAVCHKLFTPSLSSLRKGMGKFCSSKCYGTTLYIPLRERFQSRINKNGPIPNHTPDIGKCWEWTGGKTKPGYGAISAEGNPRKLLSAHRVSWQIHFGDIPKGFCVLHKCDNRSCVNPEHLFLGTKGDNWRDCLSKNRAKIHVGEKSHAAKITEKEAQFILARKKQGDGPTKIARETNLPYNAVYGVWSRTRWKHLSFP